MIQANRASASPSKTLHIVLWCVQIALALLFAAVGIVKLATPIQKLAESMPWAAQFPPFAVRLIGASELAGSLGLILPAATRVQPRLTILAALGLLTVMLAATVFHVSRGEANALPITIVIGGLSSFVAWGRTKVPIAPRA